ncbi:uncharacterized protein LOC126428020 [Schistocerca serialis cubense]|uniref:uncharacterized protein LOC126428020 n=1 Tax=Schistocerca serialis cubense TaxID=2023355 RepID=UPI00214DF2DF|nr:uncharacterized protein LOC126428020 [Schistocerca serialis cubense]
MDDCKPVRTPLATRIKLDVAAASTSDRTQRSEQFPERILMYIAIGTRPDICHAVNKLSQYNNSHNLVHWQAAKRILSFLPIVPLRYLTYIKDKEGIFGFADADWGNSDAQDEVVTSIRLPVSKSAISWCSHKQRIVALSSSEAEHMSTSKAAKEAVHLSTFVKELALAELPRIGLFANFPADWLSLNSTVSHSKTKHIHIKYDFIRQAL